MRLGPLVLDVGEELIHALAGPVPLSGELLLESPPLATRHRPRQCLDIVLPAEPMCLFAPPLDLELRVPSDLRGLLRMPTDPVPNDHVLEERPVQHPRLLAEPLAGEDDAGAEGLRRPRVGVEDHLPGSSFVRSSAGRCASPKSSSAWQAAMSFG
jgi:hypothetical protein